MGLFDEHRKRRAIKAFSKRPGPALRERFGNTPYYSADQIRDVVSSGKLHRHRDYLVYAYCLFMAQPEFESLESGAAAAGFDALRSEAHALIGPGPAMTAHVPGSHGDPFAGPSPGDFGGGGDGSPGL